MGYSPMNWGPGVQPGRREWPRCEHAARLGRSRHRAGLYRLSVCRGELRRPGAAGLGRAQKPAVDLSAFARGLLHLLDLLRLGRSFVGAGFRLSHDLYRPGADDDLRLSARTEDRAAGEGAEHQLDRRLYRGPIRQEPDGRGDRDGRRRDRRGALYRAATQGGVGVAPDRSRPATIRLRVCPIWRPCARRRSDDGGVRGAIWYAPHRRDGAPGRTDARDRDRVAHEARRLHGRRLVRDLLPVRRADGPDRQGCRARRYSPDLHEKHQSGDLADDDGAVAARDRAAAASVPRDGRREQRRGRTAPRGLAVSALSRAHQSVRRADRHGGADHFPGKKRRQRYVRAGAAACRKLRLARTARLRRRPVGRHRHGDRRERRGRDHGLERLIVPLVLAARGAETGTRDDMGALLLRARRFSIFCVLLLAYLYYHIAGEAQLAQIGLLSFAAVAQFGPAFFGGLFWRRATARGAIAGLAIGVGSLGLHTAAAELRCGRPDRSDDPRCRPVRISGTAAAGAVRPRGGSAHPRRVLEPRLNIIAFVGVSLFTSARRRSSGCKQTYSSRPRAHRSRRASGCGARRSPSRS